jgi:hypothetical protein
MPDYDHIDRINAELDAFCDRSLKRIIAPNTETIGERFAHEQLSLLPLPPVMPRACVTRYVKINKYSEISFERNWYSVPTQYAFRDAIVEVYEDRLHIIVENERIAQHPRGFGSNERYLDLVHYVDLLQHKHRSAATALVLADGRVPDVLHELFARYRQQNDATATRRWTKVLALLVDTSVDQLAQTVTHALAMGTDDPSAIELLLRQRSLPKSPVDLNKHSLPTSAQLNLPSIDLSLYAMQELMENIA